MATFIVIGENIHCTRIFKRGGKYVQAGPDGAESIAYQVDDETRHLPIPAHFLEGPDAADGKIRHTQVAIWQGLHGDEAGREAGRDFLRALAVGQTERGAHYLDVNVDEYGRDVAERIEALAWLAELVQEASPLPLSIDSSNPEVLRAGLAACVDGRARMLNSVSLERIDALALVREFDTDVVASAAGETGLPSSCDEKLANLGALMPRLKDAGLAAERIHIDPLVLPIATDPANGQAFFDACRAIRDTYGPVVHIVGVLSNVSFGMPNRKLLNRVFSYLAVQAGADGGIVNPDEINGDILDGLDPEAESFKLAAGVLTGQDMFGMEYISAHREGRL